MTTNKWPRRYERVLPDADPLGTRRHRRKTTYAAHEIEWAYSLPLHSNTRREWLERMGEPPEDPE